MKNTDINETLQNWWAERRKCADTELLSQNIMRAIKADGFEEPAFGATRIATAWLPRVGYALAGAAAMALVLLAVQRFSDGATQNNDSGFLAMGRILPEELASSARVFDASAQLFDDRLKWIIESNGDVGMGIDSCPEGNVENSAPVFVRVMVLERCAGEDTWHRTWKADVIVREQEMAQIAVNGGKHHLLLWVYPLADGHLLVDTDFSQTENLQLAARQSTIMCNGEPAEIASMRRGTTEYRVVQTASVLTKQGAEG